MRKAILFSICVATILMIAYRACAGIPFTHTSASVTTASAQVAPLNSTRRLLILENTSDTPMYCDFSGAAAVVGSGLFIDTGSTSFNDVSPPSGPINCIHNGTGTKTLLVTDG